MRQGRIHIIPLGFLLIMAGAVSTGSLNAFTAFKAFILSVISSFVASAPNDYFDADMDMRLERKQSLGNYVQNKNLGRTVAISSILAAFIASLLINTTAGISLFAVTVLSILYSVAPFRFKGRAPLDSLCNGLGAFFIFAMGVGLAGGAFSDVISGAYWFSLIIVGIHGITAIPDMEEDRKEGLRTMPILIGKKKTVALTQAAILAALYFENFSILTSGFLFSLFVAAFILWKDWDEINMNRLLLIGVAYCTIYFSTYVVLRGVLNVRF